MTVLVLLDLTVKSDDLPASYAAVEATLAETRKRDGAVSVVTWIDETDPARMVVIESWESHEALDAYRRWRATDAPPHAMIGALAAPPSSRSFIQPDHQHEENHA